MKALLKQLTDKVGCVTLVVDPGRGIKGCIRNSEGKRLKIIASSVDDLEALMSTVLEKLDEDWMFFGF